MMQGQTIEAISQGGEVLATFGPMGQRLKKKGPEFPHWLRSIERRRIPDVIVTTVGSGQYLLETSYTSAIPSHKRGRQ